MQHHLNWGHCVTADMFQKYNITAEMSQNTGVYTIRWLQRVITALWKTEKAPIKLTRETNYNATTRKETERNATAPEESAS